MKAQSIILIVVLTMVFSASVSAQGKDKMEMPEEQKDVTMEHKEGMMEHKEAIMEHKEEMNEAYRKFFPTDPPTRNTVAVAGLDDKLDVEIEVIAAAD